MKFLTLILILSLGCATASYNPTTGASRVFVLGQSTAKATAEGSDATGGALSDGLTDLLSSVAKSIGSIFGADPEPPTVIVNVPEQ